MSEEKTLCDKINDNCDGITAICKDSDAPCTCGFVGNIRQYAGELELAEERYKKAEQDKLRLFQNNFEEVQRREKWEARARAAEKELTGVSAALKEVSRLEGANSTLEAQLDESRICRRRSEARLRSLANTLRNWGV